MKEKKITLNSIVLYVIAFLLTTIIHEFGHAIIGLINGSKPILHHNYVEHLNSNNLLLLQKVSISLAGPLISLIQGLLIGSLFIKTQKHSLYKLFLLWFSILGLTNFFGYLMTGPIFQKGDIGKVFLLLNTPLILQIIIAFIGAALLFYMGYKLTIPFLEFSNNEKCISDAKSRENYAFKIIIIPWIIGATIVTILYLPVIAIVSIIYPLTSGMIFIFPWKNAKHITNLKISKDNKIGKYSFGLYLILIVLLVVFKIYLAPGIML